MNWRKGVHAFWLFAILVGIVGHGEPKVATSHTQPKGGWAKNPTSSWAQIWENRCPFQEMGDDVLTIEKCTPPSWIPMESQNNTLMDLFLSLSLRRCEWSFVYPTQDQSIETQFLWNWNPGERWEKTRRKPLTTFTVDISFVAMSQPTTRRKEDF